VFLGASIVQGRLPPAESNTQLPSSARSSRQAGACLTNLTE
jgi:hypothetical protein